MNKTDKPDSIRRVYGKRIHLYGRGMLHHGWFLIPVDWGNNSYTITCLSPYGTYYVDLHHYPSTEEAKTAGRALVEQNVKSPNLSQGS